MQKVEFPDGGDDGKAEDQANEEFVGKGNEANEKGSE